MARRRANANGGTPGDRVAARWPGRANGKGAQQAFWPDPTRPSKGQARKDELRRKILLGVAVVDLMGEDERTRRLVEAKLRGMLRRAGDRELFAIGRTPEVRRTAQLELFGSAVGSG